MDTIFKGFFSNEQHPKKKEDKSSHFIKTIKYKTEHFQLDENPHIDDKVIIIPESSSYPVYLIEQYIKRIEEKYANGSKVKSIISNGFIPFIYNPKTIIVKVNDVYQNQKCVIKTLHKYLCLGNIIKFIIRCNGCKSRDGILSYKFSITSIKIYTDIQEEALNKIVCNICFEPIEKFVALIPCGHSSFCIECLKNISNICPICTTTFTSCMNIYI